MSEASRALAVKACEDYRSADLAREQSADCHLQAHVRAANVTGVAIEADVGRLASEIRLQAGERGVREAQLNAQAVNPYRFRDATHCHPPSAQYLSYY